MSTNYDVDRNQRATFLFTMPSFIQGAAQVFDMSGDGVVCYNTSDNADERALYQDWAAVGDDLVYGAKRLLTR